jgi:hypothetical protein
MLFKSKKRGAADASAAAALIAIIGGLIVLYILFLPPEEREKVLDLDEENGVSNGEDDLSILLEESPKRLFPAEKKEFEQLFSAVTIYVGEEGREVKRVNTLYATRGLFRNNQKNISFDISDLSNTKKALLNFYVEEGQGRLRVRLNGREIFNQEIEKGNIEPVNIKEILRQGKNTLEFEVSSPGAAFWRTNEYSLTEVLITADIIRRDTQESILTFVVDATERDNLKTVKLRYLPECVEKNVGPLSIAVNNYNLYSSVPADCNIPAQPIQFLPDRLVVGENKLKFSTTQGWYLIDNIRLTSELKEIIVPVYYFELEEDEYQYVQDDEANVTLYMKFIDDVSDKVADITVNNHLIRLDQTEVEYNETINNFVEKGNNAIKIEAEDILDIVELKVQLES